MKIMKFGKVDLWPGAVTTFDQNGILYEVSVDCDYDTTPDDFDHLEENQILEWHKNEWCYLAVCVTVKIDDIELGKDSVVAVESFADEDYLNDLLLELAEEALENAKANYKSLGRFFA